MIQTLSTNQVANLLIQDNNAAWSFAGAKALAEYLEEYEDSSGTPMEFDAIAIRCEFTEYADILEAARVYDCVHILHIENDDGTENEDCLKKTIAWCLEWLQDRTQVIEFEGGIIIQDF